MKNTSFENDSLYVRVGTDSLQSLNRLKDSSMPVVKLAVCYYPDLASYTQIAVFKSFTIHYAYLMQF